MNKNMKNKGITLIALIITIIVLLILAGITIALTIGQNGILSRAQESGLEYKEKEAMEKLELVLLDLQADKKIDSGYNENEYIDSRIQEKGMSINGVIAIVDGWQFQIDRSIPKIINALGKGSQIQDISVVSKIEYSTDYTKAIIKLEITYNAELADIQINGENIEIPERIDGKYVIEKEITENGVYNIYIKNENDEYKTEKIESKEISEDLAITSVEELVAFRDKVNEGRTFEGKTIILGNNLDLSTVSGESIGNWIPIGDYSVSQKKFKGTFDGAGFEIDGMYIDSTSGYQGLFGFVEGGIIKNLGIGSNSIIKGGNCTAAITGRIVGSINYCYNKAKITGNHYTGGIVGYCESSNIENCMNFESINGNQNIGGITGLNNASCNINKCINNGTIDGVVAVAGICGYNQNTSTVTNSYNMGDVNSTGADGYDHSNTGGVCGVNVYTSTVKNCYNTGNVTAAYPYVGGIVGYNGNSSGGTQTVCNVFNTGTIKRSSNVASSIMGSSSAYAGYIIGRYGTVTGKNGNTTKTAMSEWTNETITTNLSSEFTKDIQNEDGTWKYNEGCPILKWQIEE